MNFPRRRLPALLLLLTTACRTSPADAVVYAPHEEGLTLAYENPSLEGQARTDSRLQVRVGMAQPAAGGTGLIGDIRHTRMQGEERFAFEAKGGGLRVVDEQKHSILVLPEGFPDRVNTWGGKEEILFRVLGRGTQPQFDRILPKDATKVGLWIEGQPAPGKGPRTRTFLLPEVGAAEVLEWREGRWIPVMRLVGRRFTDERLRSPAPVQAPAKARGKKA